MMYTYFKVKRLFFTVSILAFVMWLSGCASTGGREKGGEQTSVVMSADEVKIFNAAMSKMDSEDYEGGIELLKELTAQTRMSPIPFINMAIAYKKLEDFDSAEENLKIALEIEPQNPVANNEYGLLLRRVGRFSEARDVYENILRKYPNFALGNRNLGVLCDIYIRDYSCALEAYKAYSASVPDDDKVKIWISDLEFRASQ